MRLYLALRRGDLFGRFEVYPFEGLGVLKVLFPGGGKAHPVWDECLGML